jgi:hypothetical protein
MKAFECCVFAVYDSGTVFSPEILDITDDDIRARFMMVCASLLSKQLCLYGSMHRCIVSINQNYIDMEFAQLVIFRQNHWCVAEYGLNGFFSCI